MAHDAVMPATFAVILRGTVMKNPFFVNKYSGHGGTHA
jgi:hypothetical protein